VIGIRLVGVRPDSVLGALGLEPGDVLRSVNGFELTSPERMFDAYARLSTAPRLHLAITHSGRPMEIDYEVR
jgi:general secretion pathway protein C